MAAIRKEVSYRYESLNWEFLKLMAEIAGYAGEKYKDPKQYTESRLVNDQSPVNHIAEHVRSYLALEPHDHFKTVKHNLAAIAYNAMMEFYYLEHGGPTATSVHYVKEPVEVQKTMFPVLSSPVQDKIVDMAEQTIEKVVQGGQAFVQHSQAVGSALRAFLQGNKGLPLDKL